MALTFQEAEQLAIETDTCFCVCGCMADGVPSGAFLGMSMPGICKRCKAARKDQHERIATPAMYEVSQQRSAETEPVAPVRVRRERVVTEAERAEAVSFLVKTREVGPTLARIAEKIGEGAELTTAEVEAVIRAKRADERAATSAEKRLMAEHRFVGERTDLTRLRIPPTLTDGTYAVESGTGDVVILTVERPTTGELAGWVVVKLDIGEGITKYGVQEPKRFRWMETYRGWYPQLVAKVIANPAEARARYEQLGVAA